MKIIALLTTLTLGFAACLAHAGDRPPEGIKPLSEIVLLLEKAGYSPISEIEFDDGHWEVDAYRNGEKVEINVDPRTGEIKKDK